MRIKEWLCVMSKILLQLKELREIHVGPVDNYKYDCVLETIPSTYRKADICSASKMWKDVMMEEMNSPHKNDTWELIGLPKGKNVIGCNWVFQRNNDI